MKKSFDPRALMYLLVLFLAISLLFALLDTVSDGDTLSRYGFSAGLILLGLYITFLMFQIPLCLKLGWYARGERLIQGVLLRDTPPRALIPLLFHLFMFQYQQGRLAAAMETLDQLSRTDLPSEGVPIVELNRATLLAAEDRAQEALEIYRRYSVDDFSGTLQAVFLNNLAFVYFLLGIELEIGIELVDRAFNMHPDPRFSRTFAGLLFKSGSLEAAQAWCRYGLKKLPRSDRISRAWGWYIQGLIGLETGQHDAVRKAVVRGLALSPLPSLSERLQALGNAL